MKKLLLIFYLFFCIIAKAQYPQNPKTGNSTTLTEALGSYGGRIGYVFSGSYGDTSAANISFIKNVPGQLIRVGDTLYMRSADISHWIKQGGSGGGSGTVTGAGKLLTLNGTVIDFGGRSASSITASMANNAIKFDSLGSGTRFVTYPQTLQTKAVSTVSTNGTDSSFVSVSGGLSTQLRTVTIQANKTSTGNVASIITRAGPVTDINLNVHGSILRESVIAMDSSFVQLYRRNSTVVPFLFPSAIYLADDSAVFWAGSNRESQISLFSNGSADQWATNRLSWRTLDSSAKVVLTNGETEIYGGTSEISVHTSSIVMQETTGNVGIGTASPTSIIKLHVVADAGNFGIAGFSSAGGVGVYGETSNANGVQGVHTATGGVGVLGSATAVVADNTGAMFIAQNGTNSNVALTVPTASGRVGFGTVTPSVILDVEDNSGSDEIVKFTNTSTGGGVVNIHGNQTSGTSPLLNVNSGTPSAIGKFVVYSDGRVTAPFINVGTAAAPNRLVGWNTSSGDFNALTLPSVISSFTFNDSLRWVSVIAYGADKTGATNSSTAFTNAIATGLTVYVPPGRYLLQTGVTLNVKQTIFGEFGQSIIFTDQTTCDMITATDSCTVANLSFYGTGQGTLPGGVFTLQNGVRLNGNNALIESCTFKSIDGSGAYAYPASGSKLFNRVSNCYMEDCTIGFFDILNSEYMTIENTIAYSCVIGFWDRSAGNNRYIDITAHTCTDGFRLTAGGNSDHGTVIGTFNHSTNNLNVQSCATGMIFTGCNFFTGNILLGSTGTANKVIITESAISTGSITPTTTTNCVIRDNYFGASVVENAASGTLYINNIASSSNSYYGTVASSITSAQLLSSMTDETGTGVLVFGTTPTFTTSIIDPLVIGSTSANGSLTLQGNNSGSGNTGTTKNLIFKTGNTPTEALSIDNTGEIGINTSPAAGIDIFQVARSASAANQWSLVRNSSVQNIFQGNNDGGTRLLNQNTGTANLLIYGRTGISFTNTPPTPTATLHLGAGTTAASTAPLKLVTGTSMTAAESGAVEFTTDDLFFTITTGTARKRFLFADPVGGLTSGRVPFVTTNGRLTDDASIAYSTSTGLALTTNLSLNTAGNKITVTEGTDGRLGQTALVSGTTAITINGLTTSSRAFVTLVTPSGVTLTTQYQAVCTANTLTIQANVAAGTINTADGSTLNYFVFN